MPRATQGKNRPDAPATHAKPSSLLDPRVIYCGDNLQQLARLPDACVDLVYIDPPFNSNRNYEVFWGETKERRAFDFMRPRCVGVPASTSDPTTA